MKKSPKSVFICQSCGYKTPKWMGKCPDCGQWHTLAEETHRAGPTGRFTGGKILPRSQPVPITEVSFETDQRLFTRIEEFDRVLGGGLVPGTLVLIGGDPGIGKSTLMLQALHGLAADGRKVLYVSGEESLTQLKMRSQRLNTASADLWVVAEIEVEAILEMTASIRPDVLVIDSIQTMHSQELTSAPGSVSQVRECALRLMLTAKQTGVSVFLVGHVTKEGAIAGPRLLEHMVDTVLYFEGDRHHVFRILRAVKNRFGPTNEIGIFQMDAAGLGAVQNPSAVFLAERPENAPGSVVTACMEGTRPILVEIQALATSSNLGTPRRTVLGIDPHRVALLVAVMEKKLGLHLSGHDVFVNVAGGVKIDEPAVDMAIVASVASSFLDRPVAERTIVLGEVGLAGEVRTIGHVAQRIAETRKMGFTRCLVPHSNLKRLTDSGQMTVKGIKTVAAAMEEIF